MDDDGSGDRHGFKKPHKLESTVVADADLVAYFRQLEVPLSELSAASAASAPDAASAALVSTAHRELSGRAASLASHKKTSRIIETLLNASPAALLVSFWDGISPYAPWLSCNRYSSHVMQTFAAAVARALVAPDVPVDAEAAGGAPVTGGDTRAALARVAADLVGALRPHLLALLYDESAAHVIRSSAALVSGAAPEIFAGLGGGSGFGRGGSGNAAAGAGALAGGRGGESSKKSGGARGRSAGVVYMAPAGAEASGDDASARARAASDAFFSAAGPSVRAPLARALSDLLDGVLALGRPESGGAVEELGALACDPNAGPSLQCVLKAAAGAAPSSARVFARALLNWGLEGLPADARTVHGAAAVDARVGGKKRARADDEAVADVGDGSGAWIDRLVLHPIGSHAVEAVFVFGDAPFRAALCARFSGRALRFALHSSANFTLQRALAGGTAQSLALAVELVPHVPALVAGRREGVILAIVRAIARAQAVADGRDTPRALVNALAACAAGGDLLSLAPAADAALIRDAAAGSLDASRVDAAPPADAATVSTRVAAASSGPLRSGDARLARWWLNINGARDGGGGVSASTAAAAATAVASNDFQVVVVAPVSLSPLGIQILSAALSLRPALAKSFVDSLCSLPSAELASVCGDPLATRVLIEPLVETPPPDLAWARAKLAGALRGNFAALACGRFGSFVVSKLFTALDARRKASLAVELVDGERALLGSPGGRAVLKLARVEHFKSNAKGWESSWSRAADTRERFADILGPVALVPVAVSTTDVASASAAVVADEPVDAAEETDDAKRERKLARKAAKKAAAEAEAAGVAAALAAALAPDVEAALVPDVPAKSEASKKSKRCEDPSQTELPAPPSKPRADEESSQSKRAKAAEEVQPKSKTSKSRDAGAQESAAEPIAAALCGGPPVSAAAAKKEAKKARLADRREAKAAARAALNDARKEKRAARLAVRAQSRAAKAAAASVSVSKKKSRPAAAAESNSVPVSNSDSDSDEDSEGEQLRASQAAAVAGGAHSTGVAALSKAKDESVAPRARQAAASAAAAGALAAALAKLGGATSRDDTVSARGARDESDDDEDGSGQRAGLLLFARNRN